MRRFLAITFSLFAALSLSLSCSDGPKVIPVKKMRAIYKDIFLADQWLEANQDKREQADTTWFYKPVFDKYGYTIEDYHHSVAIYLGDPKRYSEMLGWVSKDLKKEAADLKGGLETERKAKHSRDSLIRALGGGRPAKVFESLDFSSFARGYEMSMGDDSLWRFVPVQDDTTFNGPAFSVRDSVSSEEDPMPVLHEEEISAPSLHGVAHDECNVGRTSQRKPAMMATEVLEESAMAVDENVKGISRKRMNHE